MQKFFQKEATQETLEISAPFGSLYTTDDPEIFDLAFPIKSSTMTDEDYKKIEEHLPIEGWLVYRTNNVHLPLTLLAIEKRDRYYYTKVRMDKETEARALYSVELKLVIQ